MADCMTFPDTVEEFMEQYKVVDTDGVYMSKGSELVPIFRMMQWFEQLPSEQPEPPTDDCISRKAAITLPVMPKEHREYQTINLDDAYEQGWNDLQKCIESLPSAQPEIIRCKDCLMHGVCRFEQGLGLNGYCSQAERRTDE